MPALKSYAKLAPFSIEELVAAANSTLRERPRLHVTRRTVRFYVSEKVLPPPGGSPKYARYEFDHLVRLVGARCLLHMGRSLDACRLELDELLTSRPVEAAEHVQSLVVSPSLLVKEMRVGHEIESYAKSFAYEPSISLSHAHLVRRIPLPNGFVLESPEDVDEVEALESAARSIDDLLNSLRQ